LFVQGVAHTSELTRQVTRDIRARKIDQIKNTFFDWRALNSSPALLATQRKCIRKNRCLNSPKRVLIGTHYRQHGGDVRIVRPRHRIGVIGAANSSTGA
jgi:hypothetical protein